MTTQERDEMIEHVKEKKVVCKTCEGKGYVWAPIRPLRCPTCKGKKYIPEKKES